jgi:hypothetical protein
MRIASENARLVTENSLLKARLSSRNVVDLVKGHPSREAARIPTR